MTNILNTIITNQSGYHTNNGNQLSTYTVKGEETIKPMEYKGKLLPSRIIGSPIEYAKDIKKDIVNIGRAANGKGNDHELGRINDLAMKLGSLGLAAYLFVKNPLKLSKTMEFVGFSTFFGAMALWPKLAIQAPLKARTGVDIHQKYIDSQGRKKMLYQDPQYVLTDLYSKEDLDKIGKKLDVKENLPDREKFIKQRAQKTALQGNTLWMLTAGFASPIMSALACNVLEKPIQKGLENIELRASSQAIQNGKYGTYLDNLRQMKQNKVFANFLANNADRELDDSMISELSRRLTDSMSSETLKEAVTRDLQALRKTVTFNIPAEKLKDLPAPTPEMIQEQISSNISFLKNALKDCSELQSLSADDLSEIGRHLMDNPLSDAAQMIADKTAKNPVQARKLTERFAALLEAEKATGSVSKTKIGEVAESLQNMFEGMASYAKGQKAVDRYIFARIGKQAGTYQANQWGRFGNDLIGSLHLSMSDLDKIANADDGGMAIIEKKLTELAANPKKFDKTIKRLMKRVAASEKRTGDTFLGTAKAALNDVQTKAGGLFREKGFTNLADKLEAAGKTGSLSNGTILKSKEEVQGAFSSFYRVLQTLSLYKDINSGAFKDKLKELTGNSELSDSTIARLTEIAKKVMLSASTTDYIEKFGSQGFEISEEEYKIVMGALFGGGKDASKTLEQSLESSMTKNNANQALLGFRKYIKEFKAKVVNWENGMTPELGRRTIEGVKTNGANGAERNALVGSSVGDTIKGLAKRTINSKHWLRMFGGAMIVLTAVTLIAGLLIGRKDKVEKQEEAKLNG